MVNSQYLLTTNPDEADWHYLPVFWTRWRVNNKSLSHVNELKKLVNEVIICDVKTFTICQHKDAPFVSLGKAVLFLASRKNNIGIDIPLLSSPHKLPKDIPDKRYFANFVGKNNHALREEMFKKLKEYNNIFLKKGNESESYFVLKMLESYASLCPRGMGGSSFRLYEPLQIGTVPIVIGDIDIRPFKEFIDWEKVSLYTSNVNEVTKIFESKEELLEMGI